MASYIPQLTDTGLQTDKYVPNYEFLQTNLQKKETQYIQGQQQVASDYSAILNAPITNEENKAVKQDYLKTIQEGLKKVATTDLSLPKNVTQAENLYAPFWQDNELLTDISYTKKLESQFQRARSDEKAKDKDIRDSYNPDSIVRLQWAQQDLRKAKRGDGSISGIEVPEYTPYIDPLTLVNEFNEASGFEGITTQRRVGATLITTKNGPAAEPDLETRVNGILGDKLNHQFAQRGYNIFRSQMKVIEEKHPDYDREHILKEMVTGHYNRYIQVNYDKPIEKAQDLIQTAANGINDIRAKKNISAEDQKAINNFQEQIDQANRLMQGKVAQKQKELLNKDGSVKTASDIFPDFIKNPEHYYGALERADHIEQIAHTLASDYSYKEELDPVYKFNTETNIHNKELYYRGVEAANTAQNNIWQHQDRLAGFDNALTIAAMNSDGSNGTAGGGAGFNLNPSVGLRNEGPSTTTVEHLESAGTNLIDDTNNALLTMNKGLFSSGITNSLLTRLGIPDEDVRLFNGFMSKRYTPEGYGDKNLKYGKGERQAFEKITQTLKSKGYIKGEGKSGDEVIDGIGQYLLNELTGAKAIKAPAGNPQELAADRSNLATIYGQWSNVMEAKAKFEGLQKATADFVKGTIATPTGQKTYSKLLNDQKTGLANVSDVMQRMPKTLKVQDPATGTIKVLTGKDLADAYLHKSLSVTDNTLSFNNNTYSILEMDGQPNIVFHEGADYGGSSYRFYDHMISKVLPRYGSYTERDNLNSSLFKNVPATLDPYKDKTGAIGNRMSWPIGRKGGGKNEALIAEALNPNAMLDGKMYYSSGEEITPEDMQKVKAYLHSDEKIVSSKIQSHLNNVSSYHAQSVEIQLPTDKELGTASSQTITIPIKKNAPGTLLSSIPNSNGISVWDKIGRGETITASPWDKVAGIDYELALENPNDLSTYVFKWSTTEVDPVTGKEKMVPQRSEKVDVSKATPDQIMNVINTKKTKALEYLWISRDNYNKKHPAR